MLDWQILTLLSNIVCDYQVKLMAGTDSDAELLGPRILQRFGRAETEHDPQFPLELLTQDVIAAFHSVLVGSAFKVWGLELHRQTPDFKAMKQLLDVRFRHSTDDIPHGNPLKLLEGKISRRAS